MSTYCYSVLSQVHVTDTALCAVQVEDTSKLEYQAGQEEEVGDAKDKPKPEPQKQKEQQQQDADGDNSKGEEGGEEGGVNEDVEDKFEDSHFAPPTAPEQVGRKW